MMGSPAGDFPYTVTIFRPKASGTVDDFGHSVDPTPTYVGKCAARIWKRTTSPESRDSAEYQVQRPQLLLREPMKGIDVNWELVWKETRWVISSVDQRDFDLLVSLDRVA